MLLLLLSLYGVVVLAARIPVLGRTLSTHGAYRAQTYQAAQTEPPRHLRGEPRGCCPLDEGAHRLTDRQLRELGGVRAESDHLLPQEALAAREPCQFRDVSHYASSATRPRVHLWVNTIGILPVFALHRYIGVRQKAP